MSISLQYYEAHDLTGDDIKSLWAQGVSADDIEFIFTTDDQSVSDDNMWRLTSHLMLFDYQWHTAEFRGSNKRLLIAYHS